VFREAAIRPGSCWWLQPRRAPLWQLNSCAIWNRKVATREFESSEKNASGSRKKQPHPCHSEASSISEESDCSQQRTSRDNTALRNDNSLGISNHTTTKKPKDPRTARVFL